MARWLSKPGAILHITLLTTGLSGLLFFGAWSLTMSLPTVSESPEPSEFELRYALHMIGVTPESLAAIGLSADDARTVLTRAKAHMNDTDPDLCTGLLGCHESATDLNRSRQAVHSGTNRAEAATAYASAQAAHDALVASFADRMTSLEAAAFASLNPAQKVRLSALKASENRSDMPIRFRMDDRSEEDWLQLRAALAAQKLANRTGQELDSEHASRIHSAEGSAAASAALNGYDDRLTAINTVFQDVLTD